ncbi:MAG: methyltransferase, partial [Spirochaetales bacterium]|nr:methyltransferase [Spirochaetales bacterium]
MTSRERVLAALDHKEADRVPIDFGAHRSSGISAIAYAKLKKSLGITADDIYVYDMVQQLAIVEPEILDYFDIDVIELGRGFLLDDDDWKEWVLPDGTPCKIPAYINVELRGADWYLKSDKGRDLGVQKEGCLYFEQMFWPWMDRKIEEQDFTDLDDAFANNAWSGVPTPGGHLRFDETGLTALRDGALKLRASTDRAIIGLFGGNFFEVPQFFYRIDNYLMYMGLYPEACSRLAEALYEFYMVNLEKWLGAVGDSIDVILFGDDLGGQNGPLMSPVMYRDLIKPWHSKLWKRAKELAPHAGIHLHSCGGIEPLMEDLIDAGLEMENPVQITCAGMDPSELKSKYGSRFTFWGGGCDTRNV